MTMSTEGDRWKNVTASKKARARKVGKWRKRKKENIKVEREKERQKKRMKERNR